MTDQNGGRRQRHRCTAVHLPKAARFETSAEDPPAPAGCHQNNSINTNGWN